MTGRQEEASVGEPVSDSDLQRLSTWCKDASASDGPLRPVGALVLRLVEEMLEARLAKKPAARRTVGWAAITAEAARLAQQSEAGGPKPAANAADAAAARRIGELERQLAEARRVGKLLIEALQAANASAGWSADRRRTEAALVESRKLGWVP